jgi:hypothetical protein
MTWFGSNWIWIAVALGVLALHFLGHRHRGHGSGHSHRRRSGDTADDGPQLPGARPYTGAEPTNGEAMVHDHAPSTPESQRDSAPNIANDGAASEDRRAHRRHGC